MKKFIIYIFIIYIAASCKSDPPFITKIEGKQLPITEAIKPKKEIEDFIKPYKESVDKEMNNVLSYTPINLVRTDGELESSLGNLMADLCYLKGNPIFNSRTGKNIDFAMFNYGGIRAGITQGNITTQNAFNLMPFENSLVVLELTSKNIEELINYLITENKAHPLSKQFNLVITKKGYTLKINNKPLDKNKTYFVLTSDYLQNGGDNMNFFKNSVSSYNLDYKVRNVIIDYFKENDTIKVSLDGRFMKEK
ncbi:5'-nucleotidase C-terminal domain-containing protein [Lutibacter sp.]|uniref:5'-nucleotidase C-terminal domain-containing protein n=1 Tax=Lutibacter sp. TaxID=1925666 RepID=UPI003568FCEA